MPVPAGSCIICHEMIVEIMPRIHGRAIMYGLLAGTRPLSSLLAKTTTVVVIEGNLTRDRLS